MVTPNMGSDVYDYIIVGGGTAGPVVAARLAEDPSMKILILEAGQDSKDLDNFHMAGAWTKNHYGPTDWNLVTPPQEGLNGRGIHLPRGRFLGGSSGCNGTICVRGVEQDYDDWGVPGWGGKEMFRAMKKAETFHPKSWFPHDESAHGWNGPLHIEPGAETPLGNLFLESFQSKGLPYIPDMFSSGVASRGCGHAMRTTWKGSRTTGADYIVKDMERSNTTIKCDATVDKVIIEDGPGGLIAKGVRYVDNYGNRYNAYCRREVLINCGTYSSPAVLLRSGIGPKAEIEALGIQCKYDLPCVGKNLIDHQLIFAFYEISKHGLTDDARAHHDPQGFESGTKAWKENKDGWLATFPFGAFAFNRFSEKLDEENPEWKALPREPGRDPMGLTKDQPNIEFFHTVMYGGPPEYTDTPKEGQFALATCAFLCGMQSRGVVKLNNRHPLSNPFVDHRYMSDKRDLIMLSEGVRFMNEVCMTGAGLKNVMKGAWPQGATHHLNKTNEDWQPFVQKYASTSYHPVGTCKIGDTENDPTAVVDKYLRVKGVKGLRVTDCSIMPYVHSGHTQMPVYGIAEKAAEFIIQQNGHRTGGGQQARL